MEGLCLSDYSRPRSVSDKNNSSYSLCSRRGCSVCRMMQRSVNGAPEVRSVRDTMQRSVSLGILQITPPELSVRWRFVRYKQLTPMGFYGGGIFGGGKGF